MRTLRDHGLELRGERQDAHACVAPDEVEQPARQAGGVGIVGQFAEIVVDVKGARRRRRHAARGNAAAARAGAARARPNAPSVSQRVNASPAASSMAATDSRVNL